MPDLTSLEDVVRDVRYAARTLLRTPGFAVGVMSLALTIGATTAVYSTVDWLLNRSPGGVSAPERLATLELTYRDRPDFGTFGISFLAYRQLREVQDGFVDIAAYGKLTSVISDDSGGDQVVFEYVTGSYFSVLGLRPHLGRVFRPEDDVEGVSPVAILSYDFWRSRFGGDPEILDRSIRLDGHLARVVGVLPKDFEGYNLDWNGPTSVWVPLHSLLRIGPSGLVTRNISFFRVIGRLRPEMTVNLLRLKAPVWLPQLPPPDLRDATRFVITPGREMRVVHRGGARTFLGALLTVCTLMLFAGCFNVANFFLGRSLVRRHEIAVRVALGASRPRLFRQLLTEAMLLGGSATALGLGIGVGVVHLLAPLPYTYLGLFTRTTPLSTTAAVDGQMLGVALALGLGSALVFGLLPALFGSFRHPVSALKNPKPHWAWAGAKVTPRQGVLVVQVALSVVLAVTAGLYGRSFARVASVDPGFADPESVLLTRVVLGGASAEENGAFYRALLSGLEDMPEVVSAAIGGIPPFTMGTGTYSVPVRDDQIVRAGWSVASPRFFETQGIPLVAGRELTDDENDLREGLVVNRIFAETFWPGQDPVGQVVMQNDVQRRVTGVVAFSRCYRVLDEPGPCAWRALQPGGGSRYLRVHTRGDPLEFVPTLRELVRDLSPDAAVAEEITLSGYVAHRTGSHRVAALASSALAILCILLLAAGCVSVFLSMVKGSLREIAIRMALGASNARLTRRIVRQGAWLTAAGLILGLGGARIVALRVAGELYRVEAMDPITFVSLPLIVALVGLVSVYAAARAAIKTVQASHLGSE